MESKEFVTVKVEKFKWDSIVNHCHLEANTDYLIKDVEIKDDLFKDDPIHKQLKKESTKAFKRIKEYEYKKRNP